MSHFSYFVHFLSDGSIRTVTYTADSIHGFQAVVETTPPSVARKPPSPGMKITHNLRIKRGQNI